jgi:hypothetical protein
MATAGLQVGNDSELRGQLEGAVDTIGATLSSLVSGEIRVDRGGITIEQPSNLLANLSGPYCVARGAMDKAYAGSSMLTLIETPDAIAMAGMLMMTPEDVVSGRRSSTALEGEDIEAFEKLGNVLYSSFSDALSEKLSDFDIRMQDQGRLEPDADPNNLLGDTDLVVIGFQMQVGAYPESKGFVVIDLATAERWNGAPLQPHEQTSAAARAKGAPEEESLLSIPAAPIQGTLDAFVAQNDVYRVLRLSCRRVGLELRRHGRGEIPNPAAHRNGIVLIDVPPGEERRLEWCRRLKELSDTTKVALLLHHPSRQRVTQAFLSRADIILGFPCDEAQLSAKLQQGMAPSDAPDDDDDV